MTEKIRVPPPPPGDRRPEIRPSEERPAVPSRPIEFPKKLLDRFTPEFFNKVMHHLKSSLSFRTERGFELAAKRDWQTAGKGTLPKGPLVMKDGKLVAIDPKKVAKEVQGELPGKGAPAEDLTLFEKIVLARFEEGMVLGEKLEKGEARFLKKTEQGWTEFFQRFLPFTLERRAHVADLKSLIYRGLLKEAGQRPEQGTLVSDLKFLSGKLDKFARLQVQGSRILEEISRKMPGDELAQAMIAELAGGTELVYKALSHRIVNPEAARDLAGAAAASYKSPEKEKEAAIREGTRDESLGIALSARTEQLIAERLDLNLRPVRAETDRDTRSRGAEERGGTVLGVPSGKKKRGFFSGLFDEGEASGGVFVPWYEQVLRPRKFPGKVRWWVLLIYFTALATAGLAAVYVVKFLLLH